ncbi:hypothetical protein Tco_0252140 [Tanacetum coccineum]
MRVVECETLLEQSVLTASPRMILARARVLDSGLSSWLAPRDDLRKDYEKCNDISQGSRALICTLLKESSEKDRKLHFSMYGKAAQLEKQMGAKSAWFQEKYSGRTHGGIGCSSSQANCPLTEKELHQLHMDEEALKEMLERGHDKKGEEGEQLARQAKSDSILLEFSGREIRSDMVSD